MNPQYRASGRQADEPIPYQTDDELARRLRAVEAALRDHGLDALADELRGGVTFFLDPCRETA